MIAIKGGKLLTVTNGTIENGTILIENGKITAVGADVAIPEGAEVICAEGKWVTPGFIDAHTHISTFAEPQPRPVVHDGNEVSSPNTSQIRGIDGMNPKDMAIKAARDAGFTVCYTGPGSANVIGGTGFAFKCIDGATVLGLLIPGMKAVIYGFNFLLGVLSATLVKAVMNFLKKRGIAKREYTNNFLLTRASNFFYDIMVVAGIAAIRLDLIDKYWGVLLILGVTGLVVTYAYNRFVVNVLFKEYKEEQFLAMYGMLTGTASTGVILLREVDGDFKSPVADNLVYQNFPAIVFGFPIMLLATLAPVKPVLTLLLLTGFLVIMNVILFREQIFKKKKAKV